MRTRITWTAVAAALAASVPGGAQMPSGEDLPVVEHRLANGMRWLVLERRAAPTVSFVVQYRVGGVNESLGSTGIAHLLEHMLFKGTTSVGSRDLDAERALMLRMEHLEDSIVAERARRTEADTTRIRELQARIRALEDSAQAFTMSNELDRILSRNGARSLNATTSSESTIYFVELPANRALLWFVLEADRMRNPVFREFYAERDVAAEERRMRVETNPGGLLYEAHMAAAFRVHPYGVPVIGHMSDLVHLSRRQVEDYYRRYYGPRNAVVAVVGDVRADSVVAWAERYFGGVPPGEVPQPVLAEEPPQRGERRVQVMYDAEPQLRIGWRGVEDLHPDAPALTMLSSLLTGGRTSRLYRRLVLDDRLATFVSSGTAPGSLFPGIFAVDAYPRSPHTPADVEAAVYEELDRLRTTPPDDVELQRVRNQLAAGAVRRLQSNLGLAFQLAGSEALYGDWRRTFGLSRRIAGVTPEDVSRVVRTYLTRENRTVATLVRGSESAAEER